MTLQTEDYNETRNLFQEIMMCTIKIFSSYNSTKVSTKSARKYTIIKFSKFSRPFTKKSLPSKAAIVICNRSQPSQLWKRPERKQQQL